MSIYALGATKDGEIAERHRSVLRSRLSAFLGPAGLLFHGEENASFQPEDCAAVVIAGGNITATPEDVEHILRYPQAMRWFSESTIGISLGVTDDFNQEKWQRRLSAIDSLKTLAVRDTESARILRQAGIQATVLTCADLAYLLPVGPRTKRKPKGKPVLGIVTGEISDNRREAFRSFESDFEVRYVSPSNFDGVDVCLTTELQGVIHSVLHEIPFASVRTPGATTERECKALGYPEISDVRNAWSERIALQELLQKAKPHRLRLAQRNIELMKTMLEKASTKNGIENGKQTLVVWAAPDEYWDEAESLLASIGSGFDCLVPAGCRVTPSRTRRRMTIPAGTLMHWAMLPEDLKQQIENRYDDAIVCHAFSGSREHLADIAHRTGRRGWEFRLWTHSCESYS